MTQWHSTKSEKLLFDEFNPESHWQRMILSDTGAESTVTSPVPVTLSVDQISAKAALGFILGNNESQVSNVTDFFQSISIAGHSIRNLQFFATAPASAPTINDTLHFIVTVPTSAWDHLRDAIEQLKTLGIFLVDVGIPLRKPLYNPVEPPVLSQRDMASVNVSNGKNGNIDNGTVHNASPYTDTDTDTDTDTSNKESHRPIDAIVAIIDFGIGFAHERFRETDTTTRFENFWAMNVQTPKSPDSVSSRVLVGTEWTKKQMDAQLETIIDTDDHVYSGLGANLLEPDVHQPLARRYSHGTHVLDLAAGYDREDRHIAIRRPIIGVQLPVETVEDTSGAGSGPWLALALDWIRARALDLASEYGLDPYPPLVLNFSFGVNAGPMDGTSVVELQLQQFIREYNRVAGDYRCTVVLPAGNSYLHRSHYHAPIGKSLDIPWRILPDDQTSSFVQIWMPTAATNTNSITVSLLPPGEDTDIGHSSPDSKTDVKYGQAIIGRIYHLTRHNIDGKTSREWVEIALRPSASISGDKPTAIPGLWTIRVTNNGYPMTTALEARVQRDGAPFSFKKNGRQSYFDHELYNLYDQDTGRLAVLDESENCPVVRAGTFNSYATGNDPLVVAGFRESDGSPVNYSGGGPVSKTRKGPDLAAVSERSPSQFGVMGAGTYSGSIAAFGGTSVAAPAVARRLIDHLSLKGHRKFTHDVAKDAIFNEVVKAEKLGIRGSQQYYTSSDKNFQHRLGRGRLVPSKPRRVKI